ncbi:MAG TPA: hypothetical protein VD905_02505 [Flavobacteriales bacterium]|nr:hypothetical protein [Flavobacteriales bacterium]
MKKIILALTVVMFATNVFAQSTLKPVIASGKETFKQEGTTSTTVFTLAATKAEIEALHTKAANMKNIKLTTTITKEGIYSCELFVSNFNESRYVQRMFSALGFSTFSINGVEKPVSELNATLAALK